MDGQVTFRVRIGGIVKVGEGEQDSGGKWIWLVALGGGLHRWVGHADGRMMHA